MTSTTQTKAPTKAKGLDGAEGIAQYTKAQSPKHAAICRALRAEIDAVLPKANGKIWHGSPVWFVGENPVVGYNVTAGQRVNLLFWNGQSFGATVLQPVGKFRAAQIQFSDVEEIDAKALRRWLRRAGKEIWDGRSYFLAQRALQKQAKR